MKKVKSENEEAERIKEPEGINLRSLVIHEDEPVALNDKESVAIVRGKRIKDETTKLLFHWRQTWREETGKEPITIFARDYRMLKEMVDLLGINTVMKMAVNFWSDERWEWTGKTIRSFHSLADDIVDHLARKERE